jgi:hypothetical protein
MMMKDEGREMPRFTGSITGGQHSSPPFIVRTLRQPAKALDFEKPIGWSSRQINGETQ